MSGTHCSEPYTKYRPEIDGLRSLAIIPVILFHGGFDLFSGGFIGVDVFFVISGYLITTILLAELKAGKFSIISFYERRARRILPALFLVMAVSIPFAWLWLLPSDMKAFALSLRAVPLFISNIHFLNESGYFDSSVDLKPLLHTWSLAVEEQFYVIFPVFLMITWKLGIKWVVFLLAIISFASLITAHIGALSKPTATFYLLTTRAWELSIGCFIAFYISKQMRNDFSPATSQIASIIGLILILYSIFAYSEATPFPSLYTLVPTVGAAFIILFARPQTIVGSLLANKVLVGIGLISYSAYLWHQPLFAFARHRSLSEPDILVFAMLSIISLLLAYLSWRFVETPFRQRRNIGRNMIFTFAVIFSTTFIGLGSLGAVTQGFPSRIPDDSSIAKDFKRNNLRVECDRNSKNNGWDVGFCAVGDVSARYNSRIAVFGDSHSEALLPAFDMLGKETAQLIYHIGLGGCLPLINVDVVKGNWDPGVCAMLAKRQLEFVKNNKINKIFLVARWSLYTDGGLDAKEITHFFLVKDTQTALTQENSRAVFREALEETIQSYGKLGAKVYLIEQIPQQAIRPKSLYYKFAQLNLLGSPETLPALREHSISFEKHASLQRYNRDVVKNLSSRLDFSVINLDDIFCDNVVCLVGNSTHSYYKDEDHINANGAALAASKLKNYL